MPKEIRPRGHRSSSPASRPPSRHASPVPTFQFITPRPTLPYPNHLAFMSYVTELREQTLNSFASPHRMSPEEIACLRHDTQRRIDLIRVLEETHSRTARGTPQYDAILQARIIAREDYWLRFFRIFRVNDLPQEILTNIFRFVSWAASDRPTGIRWRLRTTWTCRHWRTIMLQDPTIWSAIWFRDCPSFERSWAWFDRAGSAPLDVRIGDYDDYIFTGELIGQFLDRLFTKLSSLRMVVFTLREWEPILVILDRFRQAGESGLQINLERFEIHRTGSPYVQIGPGFEPSSYRTPMALFGGIPTPSLQYLSLNGVHINWTKSDLTNLTTLDIRRMPLELSPGLLQFRDMLSSSPALRRLCLDGAGPQLQKLESRLPPIQLDHLKVLTIADYSEHYACYVLDHISAPKVRDLTLYNLTGEDYARFFLMITSRFPEVRILTAYSLEIVDNPASMRILVKWLESMPSLAYLRIANVKMTFLDLFLYDPQTFRHAVERKDNLSLSVKPVCPKLAVLECHHSLDMDMVARWCLVRKTLYNPPFEKIYVSDALAKAATSEQFRSLKAVTPFLYVLHGGKTVEEEALLRD